MVCPTLMQVMQRHRLRLGRCACFVTLVIATFLGCLSDHVRAQVGASEHTHDAVAATGRALSAKPKPKAKPGARCDTSPSCVALHAWRYGLRRFCSAHARPSALGASAVVICISITPNEAKHESLCTGSFFSRSGSIRTARLGLTQLRSVRL